MNRREAARELAEKYPDGMEALSARMGKRGDTLRKELTAVKGYKWGTDDEEMLIALCQAARMENALAPHAISAAMHGAQLLPLPPDGGEETAAECMAACAQNFAAFFASASRAVAAGDASRNELRRIEREAGALVVIAQKLVAQISAMHEAGRAAPMKAAA